VLDVVVELLFDPEYVHPEPWPSGAVLIGCNGVGAAASCAHTAPAVVISALNVATTNFPAILRPISPLDDIPALSITPVTNLSSRPEAAHFAPVVERPAS